MYAKFSIRDEKSEKCPRFSKKVYYLSQMQILHNIIKLYILILSCSLCLRHLNYLKCPCLSFLRIIFFFLGGGGYYFDFFLQKIRFFSSRMPILLIMLYIIILSCNLCPVTLMLCRIPMFHSL